MSRIAVNNLLPSTPYAIRVRAVNETETSEWSNRLLFTTAGDNVLPATPANVTLASVGSTFHAEWDQVTTNIGVPPDNITIARYEIEITSGAATRYVSVPPNTTSGAKVTWDL